MLSLFDQPTDKNKNLLPYDGAVFYHGKIIQPTIAFEYFQKLIKTAHWQSDVVKMYGKEIVMKRKMAWYGTSAYDYKYGGVTRTANILTPELLELQRIVERESKEKYNSCLLNLYHNGEEGMGYHSDDEAEMKEYGAIASLSLGAPRKFYFKHRETKERVEVLLEHGSLLMMKGETQKHWVHSLPVTKKVTDPRINLTFRSVYLGNS